MDSFFVADKKDLNPLNVEHYVNNDDPDCPPSDPLSLSNHLFGRSSIQEPRPYFICILKFHLQWVVESWANVSHHLEKAVNNPVGIRDPILYLVAKILFQLFHYSDLFFSVEGMKSNHCA